MLRFFSVFSSEAAKQAEMFGRQYEFNNERAKDELGIEFKRSSKEILTETAMSFIKLGLLEDKKVN